MEMQHKTMMMRAALTLLLAVMTVAGARADESGSCGDGVSYHYYSDTHKLEIYREGLGFGEMKYIPWDSYRAEIKEVVIGDGVTSIVRRAFEDCSALTSISIPNSVTSIFDRTFRDCSSLTSVSIPNSVTSIFDHTFSDCSSLRSVSIPNSVTSIGPYAFSGCTALTSISIPNSVTSIGKWAFEACSALTSINIPQSVTSIGVGAFEDCSALTSINIPQSVTTIGEKAFCGCSALTSVYCNRNTPPTLAKDNSGQLPFAGNANGRKFYVPENCVDAYKAAWSEYSGDIVGTTLYPINIIVNSGGGGTVEVSSSSAAPGEVVGLRATPSEGYEFFWWGGMGGAVFYDRLAAQTTFTMPAGKVTIMAKFKSGGGTIGEGYYLRLKPQNGDDDVIITANEYTLPTLSQPRNVFLGWCEAADGTNADIYPAGEKLTLGGDLTLYGIWREDPIILADNNNNTTLLQTLEKSGKGVNVKLKRTFITNGYWNTLCLPFDTALEGTPLEGGELMELELDNSENKTRYDNGTLYLYFKAAPSIVAGKPYLIRWGTPENPPANSTIADPEFQNVTITSYFYPYIRSDDGSVTFCGNLVPKGLEADDRSILYLGDGNTLYYPNAQMNVKSFRAYFRLNNGLKASQGGEGVRIVLGFGEGEATGIDDVQRSTVNGQSASAWHTLDGRQLLHQPTAKGLYLHGGRAVVIK